MKTYVRYLTICFFTLSSAFCGAESRKVVQNFHDMFYGNPQTLKVSDSNRTGETDFVTYTCSGGADFYADSNSGNKLAIFLNAYGEKVETTQIENLDSLRIYYAPTSKIEMTISISRDGSAWTEVPAKQVLAGITSVKMPRAGDYYVRIARKSAHIYIKEIEYICIDLSGCPNCFLYKP